MPNTVCAHCGTMADESQDSCQTCGEILERSVAEPSLDDESMSEETGISGWAKFGVFLVVTGVVALGLRVLPALNSVPEEPDATWVSPGVLGVYVVVAGIGAVVAGISSRVQIRRDPDRWTNTSGANTAIIGGILLATVGLVFHL